MTNIYVRDLLIPYHTTKPIFKLLLQLLARYQLLSMPHIALFNSTPRVYTMNLIAQILNSIMRCWLSVTTIPLSIRNITWSKIHGELHGECRDTSGCAVIITINVVLLLGQVIRLSKYTIDEDVHSSPTPYDMLLYFDEYYFIPVILIRDYENIQ